MNYELSSLILKLLYIGGCHAFNRRLASYNVWLPTSYCDCVIQRIKRGRKNFYFEIDALGCGRIVVSSKKMDISVLDHALHRTRTTTIYSDADHSLSQYRKMLWKPLHLLHVALWAALTLTAEEYKYDVLWYVDLANHKVNYRTRSGKAV